jgi:hypothetical protein
MPSFLGHLVCCVLILLPVFSVDELSVLHPMMSKQGARAGIEPPPRGRAQEELVQRAVPLAPRTISGAPRASASVSTISVGSTQDPMPWPARCPVVGPESSPAWRRGRRGILCDGAGISARVQDEKLNAVIAESAQEGGGQPWRGTT